MTKWLLCGGEGGAAWLSWGWLFLSSAPAGRITVRIEDRSTSRLPYPPRPGFPMTGSLPDLPASPTPQAQASIRSGDARGGAVLGGRIRRTFVTAVYDHLKVLAGGVGRAAGAGE
ncbi:hypothetical protein [Streptomyces collinus]|uniref:hypothetical protein n=1 Tax=Streptomyces collinus TaxID=42684 RepID=UPI0036E01C87